MAQKGASHVARVVVFYEDGSGEGKSVEIVPYSTKHVLGPGDPERRKAINDAKKFLDDIGQTGVARHTRCRREI